MDDDMKDLESIFGDIFGADFGKRKGDMPEHAKIADLEAKAKRAVRVAYNKAINDVLVKVGDALTADQRREVMALRKVSP
jgi:hypothetical protein